MNKLRSRSFGTKVLGLLRAGAVGLGGSSALLTLQGCVPALQYEEARSTAAVEAEGRRRTNEALERAQSEIDRLTQELRSRDASLEQRDESLERAKLDEERLAKQRDENATLVDQLRADLARAGNELITSGTERNRLEKELELLRAENADVRASKDCTPDAGSDPEPAKAEER